MEVLRDLTYTINNVLKIRGLFANSELRDVVERLDKYIEVNGAKKQGELITATHVLYLESKISDIEIFMPINKIIPSNDEFIYIPIFNLPECIMTKHKGHPSFLPITYTKLYRNAKSVGLEIEPPFYNIFSEATGDVFNLNECEAKVYVATRSSSSDIC